MVPRPSAAFTVTLTVDPAAAAAVAAPGAMSALPASAMAPSADIRADLMVMDARMTAPEGVTD
jgi:hypothetical protein